MPQPLNRFPRPFQVYAVLEISAYVAAAMVAVFHSHPHIALALTVIFTVASIVPPVAHPLGGDTYANMGVAITAALLWEPQDVLLGVGVGSFVCLFLFRQNEFWRAATNSAGWALPAAAAAWAAHQVLSLDRGLGGLVIAALVAAATNRAVNASIFAVFRSLRFGRAFLPEWRQSITLQWWSQLLTAPLAVVLAAVASRTENLWADLGLTATYIVALPIARQEYIYYNRSRELLDDTVEAVVRALEGTDPDARAHGDRVSALAVETGRRMRLAERDLHTLRLASRLHDVGLLAGPDPHDGKYQHAAIGGQILENFPDPLIAEYVKAHHMRWDASLKGRGTSTSIPLGARILAVAEVYDSARAGLPPFEAPLSREDAVRHLRSLAGTVLDPEVVEVFLHVVAERDEERP